VSKPKPGPPEELVLNVMAAADARRLDFMAETLPTGQLPLVFAARKAAAHLRAMMVVRRSRHWREGL